MTRAHRTVISSRNKVYNAYKLHYASRVKEIRARCEAHLLAEKLWSANWTKLVNKIAIDPIGEDEPTPAAAEEE